MDRNKLFTKRSKICQQKFKTSMLRSDLCDYSDAYIVVKGRISVTGTDNANRRNKKLTFKNNAPFRSDISKINNTFVDSAVDLDIVMPMYNLLEYSNNCSMTSGSLWNYYRDELNDSANETDDNDNKTNNNKTITNKLFEYQAKIIGSTPKDNSKLNTDVVVLLKYLSNFWRPLGLPLSEMTRTSEVSGANPADTILTTGVTFQINNAKLYFPVVTLSINDNINVKEGFKRTISWYKYRFEITTESKINNLDYLIDPAFRNINRLFVLPFKNGDNDPTRNYFDEYYMPLVEIKGFNALIENKPFFDQPVKNRQQTYEKLMEMSRNKYYTTGNVLYYLYYLKEL